ncbi:MAG: T9SS type A sorting domain-containing protein [Bacteroidota bacterium]
MRTLLLGAIAIISSVTPMSAQVCEGTITLVSQEQVGDFACTEIRGNLYIGSLFATEPVTSPITSLESLGSLTLVSEALLVFGANSLVNFRGLDELRTVGDINLYRNEQLTSLEGLGSLESVSLLTMTENPSLVSLSGLSALVETTRGIVLNDNDALVDLQSLPTLSSVPFIGISNSDGLQSLEGIGNLGYITSLSLTNNNNLTSLRGLPNQESFHEITIRGHNKLESLDALASVTSTSGFIILRENGRLESLDGLDNLEQTRALFLARNNALANLDALAKLSSARGLSISDNNSLTDISGLLNLTEIADRLSISGNDRLTNLHGLNNLRSVDSTLSLTNTAFVHVDELSRLEYVGHEIFIRRNESLQNVDGLANVRGLQASPLEPATLNVQDNHQLSVCSTGLGAILTDEYDGERDLVFRDNATGCNSVEEILATYTDTENEGALVTTTLTAAYPNPSAGLFAFSYTLAEPAIVTLAIYDMLGRQVAAVEQGSRGAGTHEIDWMEANLPAGTYVLRLDTDSEIHTQRLTLVR